MKKYQNNGAIWLKKDKNGKTFFSFKADRDIEKDESLLFFKNDKDGNPKRPDYKSYDRLD